MIEVDPLDRRCQCAAVLSKHVPLFLSHHLGLGTTIRIPDPEFPHDSRLCTFHAPVTRRSFMQASKQIVHIKLSGDSTNHRPTRTYPQLQPLHKVDLSIVILYTIGPSFRHHGDLPRTLLWQ
jgi:hypothetical protein